MTLWSSLTRALILMVPRVQYVDQMPDFIFEQGFTCGFERAESPLESGDGTRRYRRSSLKREPGQVERVHLARLIRAIHLDAMCHPYSIVLFEILVHSPRSDVDRTN